jgi:dihydroxyacetone kinase
VVLRVMSATVRRVVGGTSGPLYAVLLLRAAVVLEEADGWEEVDGADWAAAFSAAVVGVQELGGAERGDRTMVDALAPAADAFADELRRSSDLATALARMVDASAAGAAHTATLTARRGRSSYVGERAIGVPDPGAEAVTRWLAAIRDALSSGGG